MTETVRLMVRVDRDPDFDDGQLAALTGRLRTELLELDVAAVLPVGETDPPAGSKGLGTLVGWLSVHLGRGQAQAVISVVRNWAARNTRVVEVSLDGDVLKIAGATLDQQEKIIDAWLARHAPGSSAAGGAPARTGGSNS